MKKTEDEKTPPIIIKKVKKGGGGHHGGAWKVAYADFVTAMMAFFLLLWLLNVTTDEQKFAISNYFDPTFPKVSEAVSGAGGVMGGTTMATEGAMSSQVQPVTQPPMQDTTRKGGGDQTTVQMNQSETSQEEAEAILRRNEEQVFKQVEQQIRQALESSEDLKALTNNLLMDITDEGLRIQIVDQDKTAMFPSGSAQMYYKTRELMALVAKAVATLPNKLSVRGHTDSSPYPLGNVYDNWELSADRANASRRALLDGGLAPARIAHVQGKADTEHLDKANPMAPLNRRISMVLLRQPPDPKKVEKLKMQLDARKAAETPPARFQRKEPSTPFRSGGGVISIP